MSPAVRPSSVGVLARGRDYTVRDLGGTMAGYTELVRKELGVSLDAGRPWARWVGIHELAHVRHSLWTPERIRETVKARLERDVDVDAILAAEDARVNELAVRAVPDAHEGFVLPEDPQLRTDARGYVAAHGSPDGVKAAIRNCVPPYQVEAIDALVQKLIVGRPAAELTVWRVTVPLALALSDGDAASSSAGSSAVSPTASDDEVLGEPDTGGRESSKHCGGRGPRSATAALASWLIPELVEPPLTERCVAGNSSVASAETGARIRWTHGHRLLTDGVIFRRMRRAPGVLQRGTVLIDASNSMALDTATVDELVRELPHATVAMYSGDRVKARAWVVVVGKNGRRVATIEGLPRGHGNTCDGPALLWLSRQAGPRVWVSDGMVTGEGDQSAGHLRQECGRIMRAAGIYQISPDGSLSRLLRRHALSGPDGVAAKAILQGIRRIERGLVESVGW